MKKKKAPQAAKPRLQIPGYAQTWLPSIALFVSVFLLLALGYADYLRKVESLSLFLPTGMFFDHACQPRPASYSEHRFG